MVRIALSIVAAHGSTLVGSDNMAITISGQRIALVVLKVDVQMLVLSFWNDFAAGNVHKVPCIILGMTHVAMALTRLPYISYGQHIPDFTCCCRNCYLFRVVEVPCHFVKN